ncbi:hypothetical protein ACFLR1_04785 [Bacteroidota bacterium]
MKKLKLVLASVLLIATHSMAHGNKHSSIRSYADAFVFDELGVTFSVFPDGEFDFYLPEPNCSNTVSNGYVSVTFNSGYDYNPYVQYDDFGAVIQVENVPIYYDYYGRVNQIGDVRINYSGRNVCQVGGLYVHYNRHGQYAYHTGRINVWNPYFVYRPFYECFARPLTNQCFVRPNPYRAYYKPIRYTYYRPYARNVRPCYANVGYTYRPQGHGTAHFRYSQRAHGGERAVVRQRRVVSPRSGYKDSRSYKGNGAAEYRHSPTNAGHHTSNSGGANRAYRSSSSAKQKPNYGTAKSASTRDVGYKANTSNVSRAQGYSNAKTSTGTAAPKRATYTAPSRVSNTQYATKSAASSRSNSAYQNAGTSSRRSVRTTSPSRSASKGNAGKAYGRR